MELTNTHLRYLLAIYRLSQTTPDVGAAGVARAMSISKPSVTRMLNVLMERGLLVKERYGKIYLTGRGYLLARDFSSKIAILMERIPRMELGLSENEQWEAACALTAAIPERCFRAETVCPEDGMYAVPSASEKEECG